MQYDMVYLIKKDHIPITNKEYLLFCKNNVETNNKKEDIIRKYKEYLKKKC